MAKRTIQPIEDSKKTVANIARDRIRTAILEGVLPPGSRIDQIQLAKDLNTSLVPVREALKKLESEGFVQITPRRGAFVTNVSTEDMEDLYRARTLLEGEVAFAAAAHLTDKIIHQLEQCFNQMDAALHAGDFDTFSELNHRFHFLIYGAAGSKYLTNMITSLWDLAERYRYRYVFFKDRSDMIQAEHRAILDACRARDGHRLREAIVLHMNQTLHGLRRLVDHDRQKG
jgi:DNA-binding GntR family transcriptional regulator